MHNPYIYVALAQQQKREVERQARAYSRLRPIQAIEAPTRSLLNGRHRWRGFRLVLTHG